MTLLHRLGSFSLTHPGPPALQAEPLTSTPSRVSLVKKQLVFSTEHLQLPNHLEEFNAKHATHSPSLNKEHISTGDDKLATAAETGSERDTKAVSSLWVSDFRKNVHGKLIGHLEKQKTKKNTIKIV